MPSLSWLKTVAYTVSGLYVFTDSFLVLCYYVSARLYVGMCTRVEHGGIGPLELELGSL